MPKVIKKQEVLCFEGISILDFLDKTFLEKIKSEGIDIKPISIVFIVKDKDNKNNEIAFPIILAHENEQEFKDKVIHINAPSSINSEKFIKLLEELE